MIGCRLYFVLDGILYILRNGAAWADLPERYLPYRPVIAAFSGGCAAG